MVKTVVPKKQSNLIESLQQNKTQFAFCRYEPSKEALIQCHTFVQCRDFLNDVLVCTQEKMEIKIYGFSYTLEDPAIDQEQTSLLLKMTDARCLKNFQENLCILEEIEEQLGFSDTRVELAEYPTQKEAVVWVLGDPRWQKATSFFSLYTYLLKCLTYQYKEKKNWREEVRDMGTKESGYMNSEYLDFLISNAEDILSKYKTVSGFHNQKQVEKYTLHDYCGFIALQEIMKDKNSYWEHGLANYAPIWKDLQCTVSPAIEN
jgi:hypothetical protein